ncbi:MAG: hydrogenase formation protein HypD [Thermogutta sp.]
MKFLAEYRDAAAVRHWLAELRARTRHPWTIMEICGGQTHSFLRFGLDELLPKEITLVHGPGCPVCVTPIELIDKAVAIASRPGVIFCSFGDMLRVPGSRDDLFRVKSRGGDVRIVYSPLDALELAKRHADREVVFFAVGFETTAPANAMAVLQAAEAGLKNFSVLVAHVRVPPAIEAILSSPQNRVQGFLAAGHVCTVMGTEEYHPLAERYHTPIVVTGFEPADLLQGLTMCVAQLESGQAHVEIQYRRSVRPEGNPVARSYIEKVFHIVDRQWRGIGTIARSGFALKHEFLEFDADRRFATEKVTAEESPECLAGEVLQGHRKPTLCPAFGTRCTPEHPLGAPMVSSEGACAAYYRYRRQ